VLVIFYLPNKSSEEVGSDLSEASRRRHEKAGGVRWGVSHSRQGRGEEGEKGACMRRKDQNPTVDFRTCRAYGIWESGSKGSTGR